MKSKGQTGKYIYIYIYIYKLINKIYINKEINTHKPQFR